MGTMPYRRCYIREAKKSPLKGRVTEAEVSLILTRLGCIVSKAPAGSGFELRICRSPMRYDVATGMYRKKYLLYPRDPALCFATQILGDLYIIPRSATGTAKSLRIGGAKGRWRRYRNNFRRVLGHRAARMLPLVGPHIQLSVDDRTRRIVGTTA